MWLLEHVIFTEDYSTQSSHSKWGQDIPDDDVVKCMILSAQIIPLVKEEWI